MPQYNPAFICVLKQQGEWLSLFRLTQLDAKLCGPKHNITVFVEIQAEPRLFAIVCVETSASSIPHIFLFCESASYR